MDEFCFVFLNSLSLEILWKGQTIQETETIFLYWTANILLNALKSAIFNMEIHASQLAFGANVKWHLKKTAVFGTFMFSHPEITRGETIACSSTVLVVLLATFWRQQCVTSIHFQYIF